MNSFRHFRTLAILTLLASATAFAQKGYVGMQVYFMTPDRSAQFGMMQGAVAVGEVIPGSPAESSGLRTGDLITSVDGQQMFNPGQVVAALTSHHPGEKAKVGIIHPMQGRSVSLEIMVNIGSAGAPANSNQETGYYTSGNGQIQIAADGDKAAFQAPQPQGPYPQTRPGASIVPVSQIQQGACHAMLPQGWQLLPGANGQSADIVGPGGAFVGWAIPAINQQMRRFYGQMYGPPEEHIAWMVGMATKGRPQMGPAENIGNFYTGHQFHSGGSAGVVLYHTYPAPAGTYIITEYVAWAPESDPALLSQTVAVMTSLQCTASVRPSEPAVYTPHSGVPSRRHSGNSESDSLKDYNSTLGTQYAHDSAGRNYLLDRSSQWNDNGPDGPGYYIGTGVNRQKLTPGLE